MDGSRAMLVSSPQHDFLLFAFPPFFVWADVVADFDFLKVKPMVQFSYSCVIRISGNHLYPCEIFQPISEFFVILFVESIFTILSKTI